MSLHRWQAIVTYRTEIGFGDENFIEVEHHFEELHELHDIIERGPSFQTIDEIRVKYVALPEKLTIEQAASQ